MSPGLTAKAGGPRLCTSAWVKAGTRQTFFKWKRVGCLDWSLTRSFWRRVPCLSGYFCHRLWPFFQMGMEKYKATIQYSLNLIMEGFLIKPNLNWSSGAIWGCTSQGRMRISGPCTQHPTWVWSCLQKLSKHRVVMFSLRFIQHQPGYPRVQ